MHSKIMRVMVDCSVILGVILSFLVAMTVGSATESSGIGFVVFFIVLIITEMVLASEGMKVEQAENIAKIAYNTEQLVKMQEGRGSGSGYSTVSYNPPANASNSQATLPKNWACQSCGSENALDSRFCKNCGVKRMY